MKNIYLLIIFMMIPSFCFAAEVYRCGEPNGFAMWSNEKHKAGPDGFVGVNPIVIIDENEMTIVWGDSKSAGGADKTWKAIIFHESPESVSAVSLDTGESGSAAMLYTVDRKRSFLYMSTHKESALFNGSSAASFAAKCFTK